MERVPVASGPVGNVHVGRYAAVAGNTGCKLLVEAENIWLTFPDPISKSWERLAKDLLVPTGTRACVC